MNSNLTGKPELINSEPYGEGWLVIIKPRNLENDRTSLLSAEDYFNLMLEKLRIEHGKLENR